MTAFFELIKPLVEFKFDILRLRANSVFELATHDEIDKLTAQATSGKPSSSLHSFADEINLDEVCNVIQDTS